LLNSYITLVKTLKNIVICFRQNREGYLSYFHMKTKKSTEINTRKDQEISLMNDYSDMKFSLFLGEKSGDGWCPYYCSLSILYSVNSNFNTLYATNASSIVTELSNDDITDLIKFLKKVNSEKNTTSTFTSGTHDFTLIIGNIEDIYRVTATLDLFTMNETKLETGHGDSEISLTFQCTAGEIGAFYSELTKWNQN